MSAPARALAAAAAANADGNVESAALSLPKEVNSVVSYGSFVREELVQFSQADDLFQLLELPALQAEQWRPHLVFHWHGDASPLPEPRPLELNAASRLELEQTLLWPEPRLSRLLQERNRRAFDNLADLQERLCLPPEAVEQLLGKVRFGERRPSPSLPPHP